MKRYFCWVAFFAMMVVPDWASACWPLWGPRAHPVPFYAPPDPYAFNSYPHLYYYPPVYQPQLSSNSALPRFDSKLTPQLSSAPGIGSPSKPNIADSSATRPAKTRAAEAEAWQTPTTPTPPRVEAIRPAAAKESIASPSSATKKIEPAIASPSVPMSELQGGLPPLVLPKEGDVRSVPKDFVPEAPRKAAPSPTTTDPNWATPLSPKSPSPSPPPLGSSAPAVPSAAPPLSDLLIPPSSLPVIPNGAKPDALPSLSLPPDAPLAPTSKPETTSRSSPLSGLKALELSRFPVVTDGTLSDGYRRVAFFNHTSREIELSIEGREVKLPGKSFLEAKLAQNFTWSYGTTRAIRERIPEGAAGIDIVFRE